jgi:sulfur-oxidizing protein SoxX
MKRLLLSALLFSAAAAAAAGDSMPPTPSAQNADVERGRKLVQNRQETGCVLCHTIPGFKDGGEMGPNLTGLSQRLTPDQIRMRIADPRVINPQSFMPAYFSTEGLHNVAKPLIGKTVLSEQGLEDIVTYLLEATKGP